MDKQEKKKALTKRCKVKSGFAEADIERFLSVATPEMLRKLNISERKRDQVKQFLRSLVTKTKEQEFQHYVEEEYPKASYNTYHQKLRSFADQLYTTPMSHYYEREILKKIRGGCLEQKYSFIVDNIMKEVKEEYLKITHEVAVNSKVKPEDGSDSHISLTPYKYPGRTQGRQAFLWHRTEVKKKLYLMYPLVRKILNLCVTDIPHIWLDFKKFRTDQPVFFSDLSKLFQEELSYLLYSIRKFYKGIAQMVINNSFKNKSSEEVKKYLRGCSGLLSVYISKALVNTIANVVEVTADDDRIPYLQLTIAIDTNSRLKLQPDPHVLTDLFKNAVDQIAALGNNLAVLQHYYQQERTPVEKYIPMFVEESFIEYAKTKIEENLGEKFKPVISYIDHLESEFFQVYGEYSPSNNRIGTDMSFDTGCNEIIFFRKYVDKMTEKVSNEYYPIGKLQQDECVESLKKSVNEIMDVLFEKLCSIHMYKNDSICEQFELLAARALQVPQTTEELIEMGDYMLWANLELLPTLKEDVAESLKMMTKLIDMSTLSKEHVDLNTKTVNWLNNRIKPILQRNASMYEQIKFEYEERLQRAVDNVTKGIVEIKPYLVILDDMDDSQHARQYLHILASFLVKIKHMEKEIQWINNEEKAFRFPPSRYVDLDAVKEYITTFYHLVKICFNWNRLNGACLDGPFEYLNFSETDETVEEYFKELTKIQKAYTKKLRRLQADQNPMRFKGSVDDPEFLNLPAPLKLCQTVIQQIKDFRPALRMMSIMCNDALLPRHWDEMCEVSGLEITPNAATTLNKMLAMDLEADIDKYEVISIAATKERQILKNLLKMQEEWEDLKFKTSVYKDTGITILTQLDDIQAILDDHIIKTLSMRGSIFVKPYEEQVKQWYEKITRVNRTLEEWGKVQAEWLYLLPIFSSKDIVAQMPEEGALFRQVNSSYVRYMTAVNRDPRVLEIASAKGLLENLIDCTDMLEKINDGVVKYLEKKRLFFARFFFLSNDEMLEILSETKDPLRVQPHLTKCFEAVHRLKFDSSLQIHGMYSQETEYVAFLQTISTEEAKGSVEKWLVQVEEQMIASVRDQIEKSWRDYKNIPRLQWVQNWPGQVVLAVSQTYWTSKVHSVLQTGNPRMVSQYVDELRQSLEDIVNLIRDPSLDKLRRITIKALIVIDVHAKDVVEELAEKRVTDDNDFKWLAQLRYYWSNNCLVKLVNATVKYAYEYLGNSDRLVITPLTDRCYRTLIGAYHLHLNGAPEGPAGTGKTETTKDLAKALAVQCVVFNCSDGLDYKAMGKFFKGLASSGAWVCFDEFNRIEIEVLSVVAQQILSIVLAVRAHLEKFVFEGTELTLNPACYICITMNPGYAGRTELPDNLKVLFRTVAMMVPDYAMIGEISLYSYGFIDARRLSVKIVTTYRLCSEQLSSQNHYDYGMRAVKSVLSACGNNKRVFPDESEDILVLRSIIDVNLAKFLNQDVPLFEGIISDLFPGTVLPEYDYGEFITASKQSCVIRNLQPKQSFLTKIIQTYEMMIVRHGFMIVGQPFAGKSSTLNVLADALTIMNEKGLPQEKVQYRVINPKAITIGQLYGSFDPVSYEWFDGVVATYFRRFVMDTCSDRKWIIFDGPVDAVWIENMNSVLDDNKKLCLMSGEVMSMTNSMSLIFEVMDLAEASPATVSRCGMIYMEPSTLGWKPFAESWLEQCNSAWCNEDNKIQIEVVLDWMLTPSLLFIQKNCRLLCNPGQISLVRSFLQIVEILMDDAFVTVKEEDVKNTLVWIHASFVYAGVWGLGGILDAVSREKFDEFYRNLWKGLDENNPFPEEFEKTDLIIPSEGLLVDYVYNYKPRGTWRYITATSGAVDENANIQQALVTTVETQKYMFILEKHIHHRFPTLLVGPTGTGKSFYMQDLLMNQLNQEAYEPAFMTFTVKITANQAQELVLSKLHKRKRGHYGPPKGKFCVIFIDDLNMPAKDTYGSQPPIELIRQYFDHKNWYDLKQTTPIFLYDLLFVGAMGLVGGSRQDVYARFLRHFSIFSINEFSEDSMSTIYTNLLLAGLKKNGFPTEIYEIVTNIVNATVEIFRIATENLRPTPAKSHYIFNLRDFSRIIFGCAMMKKESVENDRSVFAKLWVHEVLRVMYDRLITPEDKNWLFLKLKDIVKNRFREKFDQLFASLDKDAAGIITEDELKNLMFGSYLDTSATEDDLKYEEVVNAEIFKEIATNALVEFNSTHKNKMDIVLFKYALEHLSKICRILTMPCGSGLLVGISGSGRQSLTKLASAMTGFPLFQPEITRTYSLADWRDDIKKVMRESGGRGRNCVFLFTEGQIKDETYLQDIDCLLNSGEVPNIFQIDERQEVLEMVRLAAQGGNTKIDISALAVFSFFIKRCREKLHIILCFSPMGSFRDRLRLYPSLINCCTIDWFESWPEDALEAVAHEWIGDVNLETDVKHAAVIACKKFHIDARDAAQEFFVATARRSYITSASYLELIKSFTILTNSKQKHLQEAKNRYVVGLEKLEFAESQISEMQISLEKLQPELQAMTDKAIAVTKQIEKETIEVEHASQLVKEDEKIVNVQAAKAQALKAECEADLALAIPILEDAIAALNTLKPQDITLVKSMKNPPDAIKLVMAAVCVIRDVKADRIPDPSTGKRMLDYWGPSKRILGDMNFLQQLKDFDKDNIKPEIMVKIRKEFLPHKDFKPHIVAKASSAAEGLCKWIIAMDMYDKVAKEVAPKKAKLEIAEKEFAATMAILQEKKDMVAKLEARLADLNAQLEEATLKQISLQDSVTLCSNKLIRAQKLIGGLGGEKMRWRGAADDLQVQYDCLAGDILISCGIIAYLSPFTAYYRNNMITLWDKYVKELKIPSSHVYKFASVLGTEIKIQDWCLYGLPNDAFSVENAIIIDNSRRYSLLIDPQNQANLWIKNMERQNDLEMTKFAHSDYMQKVVKCVQEGLPLLIENVEESLEAPLDPLLFKITFKQGGENYIALGENVVLFHQNFRLYLTSKLRNPHYLPEVCNKVTIINFALTLSGLEDQLLGIVVSRDRPDLQKKREVLITENAKNRTLLVQVEESILRTLSESQGDILADEKAIEVLNDSKVLSAQIRKRQVASGETEKKIEMFRQEYAPASVHCAILYYCISDLPNVDPMYQYSLSWFINLYINTIESTGKSKDIAKRVEVLNNTFTYNVYSNVCRSLFERDKLMFSFVLCTKMLISKKLLDEKVYLFLITGGVAVENKVSNPASNWLDRKSWDGICMTDQLPTLAGFKESFTRHTSDWKRYYDYENPQDHNIPKPWDSSLSEFCKLIVMKLIRPDKLLVAIARYIQNQIGKQFTSPPPFDVSESFDESSALCPLIFILSPGTDPMSTLVGFAEEKSFRLSSISLGQGQGPVAHELIQLGQDTGSWVCLQNCHLAVSWMPTLEKIWETMDNSNTHPNFRLWLTTYPSDKFPVSILQYGVKMTNEPPTGLQQNLLRVYSNDPVKNPQFFDGCSKRPRMFRRLLYALAFFHAVVQERRSFGPLGWNIPYGFNESDFEISANQLLMFINDSEDPFEAITYLIGECNYGGRVTDDWDRRLITTILEQFLNPQMVQDDARIIFAGSQQYNYILPRKTDYDDFTTHIKNLSQIHSPEVFGLHMNAGMTRDMQQSQLLLNTLTKVQGEGAAVSGETDKILVAISGDIINRLPTALPLELARLKYPIVYEESMNTVLVQEMERFDILYKEVKSSLVKVQQAVEGIITMSPALEALCNSLLLGHIPSAWMKVSYPSLKNLANYIEDLVERIKFLNKWYEQGKPPTYWLSGFFFTQAFLTGAKQNFARKYTIPIDQITFDFKVLNINHMNQAPPDGVYVYGLYTDGARWDKSEGVICELLPKVLQDYMPLMWFIPINNQDYKERGRYKCPVYKTSERRGVLSTTGHSTNYVLPVLLETREPPSHWIKRSAALLCQLN